MNNANVIINQLDNKRRMFIYMSFPLLFIILFCLLHFVFGETIIFSLFFALLADCAWLIYPIGIYYYWPPKIGITNIGLTFYYRHSKERKIKWDSISDIKHVSGGDYIYYLGENNTKNAIGTINPKILDQIQKEWEEKQVL